jgi:ArsR family transcriptional regulator
MMDIKNLELEIGLLHEKVCTALGDTTRIMMLYLLAEKSMCVNEISEALNIPQPTASRHLKVLRERDLVNTERQGTNVEYSLADVRIIQALNLMRELLTERLQAQAAITGSQTIGGKPNRKAKSYIPVASTGASTEFSTSASTKFSTSSANPHKKLGAGGSTGSANPHEKLGASRTQKSPDPSTSISEIKNHSLLASTSSANGSPTPVKDSKDTANGSTGASTEFNASSANGTQKTSKIPPSST